MPRLRRRLHRLIHRTPRAGCAVCVEERPAGLEASQAERHARFFSLSPDMLCIAGFDGYFKDLNPGWEAALGFSRAELMGRPYLEFVHEADRPATHKAIAALANGGRLAGFENRYLCKNGFYKWFRWHAVAFPEDKAIYAVACDISDRVRTRERTAWLASFPELNPNPVVELDLAGRIAYANPAAQRLFDILERGIAHPWLAGLEGILEDFRKGRSEKAEREVEVNGRWTRQSITFARKLRTVRVFGLDISELKRAESQWRQTFDTVPDLVAVIDKDSRIVRANKAFAKKVGLRPEECVGRRCYELFHGLPREPSYCPHAMTNADGKEHIAETYEENMGAWFLRSVTPFRDENGKLAGVVEVARDITAQKRTEQDLQQSAQLKSDLLSLINHEYANALTSMKLALALLKASEPGTSEERTHPYEVLGRAMENLRAYTTNFLSLHRLESGKLELNLRPTAVRAVVLDALVTLRPLAAAKKQRLSVETGFPESLPVAVLADQDCLSLVISNLVNNAVKYTPEAGAIVIRIRLESGPPECILVSVEDTGIGIPAAELERIKEGFYRTQEGREMAKGFGVGLTVASQLLAKHGSRLEIESEPGQGSRFSFRLPVWKQD
ncbi:MAG: PAS domain S-box protein [Elusimicrobia bacterium]|nr:PAS domain S-box protein [Elusimicrobiota bacterium]